MNAIGPRDDSNQNDSNHDSNHNDSNREFESQAKRNRFPRSLRLLRHADFERVYKQGRRHFSKSMTVFYWPRPEVAPAGKVPVGPGPRIGFTVGRALGGAVQRNRMKRRLREAVRLSRPAAAVNIDVDVVINPKKSLLAADFEAVRNEVARAFVVMNEKMIKEKMSDKAQQNVSPKLRTES